MIANLNFESLKIYFLEFAIDFKRRNLKSWIHLVKCQKLKILVYKKFQSLNFN